MALNIIKSLYAEFSFLLRNTAAASRMRNAKGFTLGEIAYRTMQPKDEPPLLQLFYSLNGSGRFSPVRRLVYRLVGEKLMLVAVATVDGQEKIVGMNMYYLNARDVIEGTVHEGFIGVAPEMGGRGIASNLRKMAVSHFAANGFGGISSRISIDNVSSLASAQKLGFQPVEKYYDAAMKQERFYLVCRLPPRTRAD